MIINYKTKTVEAKDLKVGDILLNEEDYYPEKITDIKEDKDGGLNLYVIDDNGNEPIYGVGKTSKLEVICT